MRKSKIIKARFTEEERSLIMQEVIKQGFLKKRSGAPNISAYVRFKIFQDGSFLNQKTLDELFDHFKKMVSIGTNFNNLAYHMNRRAKIMREEGIEGHPKFSVSEMEDLEKRLTDAKKMQREIVLLLHALGSEKRIF